MDFAIAFIRNELKVCSKTFIRSIQYYMPHDPPHSFQFWNQSCRHRRDIRKSCEARTSATLLSLGASLCKSGSSLTHGLGPQS